YIALKLAKDDDYAEYGPNVCQLPTDAQIEEFKNDLGQLGLWDLKKFRLWSVLYCSC
ncbi:hypothetical protein LCGC14_1621820, partial [marine sediment metagenome]